MRNFGPYAEKEKVPSLGAPLIDHVGYLFRHIYGLPFCYEEGESRRGAHNIVHTSRAAIYVSVLANLYRRFGDKEALSFTTEDLKLVQIAVLLHDAGREGEDIDLWDEDSGILTYQYLIKLGVTKDRAKLLAEAVANKDTTSKELSAEEISNKYYKELDISGPELIWRHASKKEKNIFQRLIHDADCLDSMPLRRVYNGEYLDLYRDIIPKENGDERDVAIDCLGALLAEVDEFIQNTYRREQGNIYDTDKSYDLLLGKIRVGSLLHQLHSEKELLNQDVLRDKLISHRYNPEKALEGINLAAALKDGKIFARALKDGPTNIAEKLPHQCGRAEKYANETWLERELRKVSRRKDVPTNSSKPNNKTKQGNPNRSISMIGYGAKLHGGVGFLIVNPALKCIKAVSKGLIDDTGSGRGKEKNFQEIKSDSEKEQKLNELLLSLKLTKTYIHCEIICDINEYHGVVFSNDGDGSEYTPIKNTLNILQAVYLQKKYEKTFKKCLPIFEYSGKSGMLIPRDYSNLELEKFWRDSIKIAIKSAFNSALENIFKDDDGVNRFKSFSNSGAKPLDEDYPEEFKNKINSEILDALIVRSCDNERLMKKLLAIFINRKNPVFAQRIINEYQFIINATLLSELAKIARENGLTGLSNAPFSIMDVKNEAIKNFVEKHQDDPEVMEMAVSNFINSGYDRTALTLIKIYKLTDADFINKLMQPAIEKGHAKTVKLLLSFEVNINLQNIDGETLLHSAIKYRRVSILNELLKRQANPDLKNKSGNTPLLLALREEFSDGKDWKSQEKIVDMLVDHAKDLSISDNEGDNALHWAIKHGYVNIIKKIILQNPSMVNNRGRDGLTALHLIIKKTSGEALEFIDLLLDNQADTNLINTDGESPLHFAVETQEINLVKRLLAKKADPNIKNQLGITPFLLALQNNEDIAVAFFDKVNDFTLCDQEGNNALHLASSQGFKDVFDKIFMLDRSCSIDVNTENWAGKTALFLAVEAAVSTYSSDKYSKYLDIISSLLEAGANPFLKNDYNESAGDIALKKGHSNIMSLLQRSVVDPKPKPESQDVKSKALNQQMKEWQQRTEHLEEERRSEQKMQTSNETVVFK